MKRWMALVACLLIDGAAVGRVFAQQTAPRPSRILMARSGGYLGVGVEDIDEDRAKSLKLSEVRGVLIKGVEDDSPAAKAGLVKDDVVLEYNGQRVEGTDQFIRLVRETPSGHKVTLQIVRNGAPQTVTAVVSTHNTTQSWVSPGDGNGWAFNVAPDVPMPAMPAMPTMPAMPQAPALPRALPQMPQWMWQNGVLGIEAESLSGQLADYFGVKEGVLIRSVAKNSPAERGGLKAGDVVVRVNGETVATPGEISSHVHHANGKRVMPFVVMRNHREMTVQVGLGDGAQDSDGGADL